MTRCVCRRVGAFAIVATWSCRSVGSAHRGPAGIERDTVRGVLSVIGAEPLTAIVLAPSGGGAALAIEGPPALALRGLSRLEVMVAGRATSRKSAASPASYVFDADTFVVRAAGGVAAHDGVVVKDAGAFYLGGGVSRTAVPFLPASLQGQLGVRVFLVGPLDRAPIAYGTIP